MDASRDRTYPCNRVRGACGQRSACRIGPELYRMEQRNAHRAQLQGQCRRAAEDAACRLGFDPFFGGRHAGGEPEPHHDGAVDRSRSAGQELLRTGTSRYIVLGVPARNAQTGQTNTIIVGGLSPEGAGAYGVYLTATTAKLERTVSGEAEGYARVQESWKFSAASGERIELTVTYRRGPVTKAHVDSVVRSGLRPDFQRTYRIDQAIDVLRSATTPDRVEALSFHADRSEAGGAVRRHRNAAGCERDSLLRARHFDSVRHRRLP